MQLESTTLLVIVFIIKLFARKPIFKYIREKYGHESLKLCRSYESLHIRHRKINDDLTFLLNCKKERLIPTFAKPKLSIHAPLKLIRDVALLIIKTEIANQHASRKKLRKELFENTNKIKEKLSFICFEALRYHVVSNVKTRRVKWVERQDKKLMRLRSSVRGKNKQCVDYFVPNVVSNFSDYVLTDRESEVLSLSLDRYIPFECDNRKMEVEFERFYSDILPHTSHLTSIQKTELKSVFLKTFQNYSNVKCSWEDQQIVDKLAKNKEIVILRQDKGRGVVVLNRTDYIQKSVAFLNGKQFEKICSDPTDEFQKKVQRSLLSMKKVFDKKTYRKLYPSASQPGLYFGLAKVHKVPDNSNKVEDLPLRPVISNIGTATYKVSKYLADILSPLTKSEYTIVSTKDFIRQVRDKKIGSDQKLVSFDVSSLFTNVPLDFTIDLIIKKVCKDKLVNTKLKEKELRLLLELCTKSMHFSFDGCIYRQVDGVAMGSPLGPVLANIFMVHLENSIVPTLSEVMPLWYRYVDDTFTFIRENEIDNVRNVLNTFHPDIKFTHEIEQNGSISFLDVWLTRKDDGSFNTEVYRKKTDTNVYIHWKSFAPKTWKLGTLKGLFRRAFLVCSDERGRDREIEHLKSIFHSINGYPEGVIKNILKDVKEKIRKENAPQNVPESTQNVEANVTTDVIRPYMVLPYKGTVGNSTLKKFKSQICRLLPENVLPRITFKGRNLGSCFRIKDKIKKEHTSDLVYEYVCGADTCDPPQSYIGETGVRFETRSNEHCKTDKNSAIYKHARSAGHDVTCNDFTVLSTGYNNRINRRIAEALFIKDKKPSLNEQVISYNLNLFE